MPQVTLTPAELAEAERTQAAHQVFSAARRLNRDQALGLAASLPEFGEPAERLIEQAREAAVALGRGHEFERALNWGRDGVLDAYHLDVRLRARRDGIEYPVMFSGQEYEPWRQLADWAGASCAAVIVEDVLD